MQFLIFLTGIVTTKVFAYGFDYVVYPFSIKYFGLVLGFFIMLVVSFLINIVLIIVYDKTKTDIFGFEHIKKMKADVAIHRKTFLARLVRMGTVITFIALSFYDPFLATLWFRKSTTFDGLTKRDWIVLALSTLIANLLWAPIIFGALKLIFRH